MPLSYTLLHIFYTVTDVDMNKDSQIKKNVHTVTLIFARTPYTCLNTSASHINFCISAKHVRRLVCLHNVGFQWICIQTYVVLQCKDTLLINWLTDTDTDTHGVAYHLDWVENGYSTPNQAHNYKCIGGNSNPNQQQEFVPCHAFRALLHIRGKFLQKMRQICQQIYE